VKEIQEQKTDAYNLRLLQPTLDFAERNVRCHQCDRQLAAGQTHGKIIDAAALGEKFRLAWKFETGFIHARLMNRPGHDCIELAASRDCNRFLERSGRGTRSFSCRFARFAIWLSPNHDVFGRIRNAPRLQREIDDFGADPGAIAQCDSYARFSTAPAHAPDRNRICPIEHEHAEQTPGAHRSTSNAQCKIRKF
jgi:hypothetical protein